eukprot:gene33984-54076_t
MTTGQRASALPARPSGAEAKRKGDAARPPTKASARRDGSHGGTRPDRTAEPRA